MWHLRRGWAIATVGACVIAGPGTLIAPTGAAVATNVLVSVDASGSGGDGSSVQPSISRDGRFVAFWSHASDLVAGDGNGMSDVFVRDLVAGDDPTDQRRHGRRRCERRQPVALDQR